MAMAVAIYPTITIIYTLVMVGLETGCGLV